MKRTKRAVSILIMLAMIAGMTGFAAAEGPDKLFSCASFIDDAESRAYVDRIKKRRCFWQNHRRKR